jgi:hypothetical protein
LGVSPEPLLTGVGQGEELPHRLGTDRPQGPKQACHHAAEQLVRRQIQRRFGQPGVATVKQMGAQNLQSMSGPLQQRPDDRLGGRIPGQRIQVTLDGGSGSSFVHGQ